MPPAVRDAFGLAALPPYPGAAQCVRLSSRPRPAGAGPDADAASGDAGPAVAAMRLTYQRGELLEADAAADPMAQFDAWFREAVAAKARRAFACLLAAAWRLGGGRLRPPDPSLCLSPLLALAPPARRRNPCLASSP